MGQARYFSRPLLLMYLAIYIVYALFNQVMPLWETILSSFLWQAGICLYNVFHRVIHYLLAGIYMEYVVLINQDLETNSIYLVFITKIRNTRQKHHVPNCEILDYLYVRLSLSKITFSARWLFTKAYNNNIYDIYIPILKVKCLRQFVTLFNISTVFDTMMQPKISITCYTTSRWMHVGFFKNLQVVVIGLCGRNLSKNYLKPQGAFSRRKQSLIFYLSFFKFYP